MSQGVEDDLRNLGCNLIQTAGKLLRQVVRALPHGGGGDGLRVPGLQDRGGSPRQA